MRETPQRNADFRQSLVQLHADASRDYDKAIITFSSGALGLSIVVLQDVFPKAQNENVLLAAWVLFVISILTITGSFLTSQASLQWSIGRLDKDEPAERGGPWGRITTVLNVIAGLAFVGGVILLLCFVRSNLGGS